MDPAQPNLLLFCHFILSDNDFRDALPLECTMTVFNLQEMRPLCEHHSYLWFEDEKIMITDERIQRQLEGSGLITEYQKKEGDTNTAHWNSNES